MTVYVTPGPRPLLVGESNPYGTDPEFALYPDPQGCAGWRLAVEILGLHRAAYLRAFERTNLCSEGAWSTRAARDAAASIRLQRAQAPIVLLGARVANAFGLPYEPFTETRLSNPFTSTPTTRFFLLPHPSGRCRLWNQPDAFQRARAMVLPLVQVAR